MRAANVGKVLGAFGLVLVLSSPYTLFFTSTSGLVAGVKAAVGLAFLGVYVATHFQQLTRRSVGRSSRFLTSSALLVGVTLAGLVALNVLAHRQNVRWDVTRGQLHTLAPQTLSTLAALTEKVRVIGFMTEHHPQYAQLELLFRRYRDAAPERFDYSFKDPRHHPDLAKKYQLGEGVAQVVLVRGEGPGETHTPLKHLSEEDLTNELVKLNTVGAQKVYFLTGHGERPLDPALSPSGPRNSLSELGRELARTGYKPEALNLAGRTEVPRDAALVVIAGARTPYTAPEAEALRRYLASGGRMLYFAEADLEPGLDELLAEYGVLVDPGIVADSQYKGDSEYVIASLFYAEHAITEPLKNLNTAFITARGLSVLRQGMAPGVKAQALVLSSPYAWEESTPGPNPSPSDGEKAGQLTLVALSTRDTRDAPDKRFEQARVVVVGDSELLLDANWGHEANRNLILNSLAWASQQEKRITLHPPNPETSGLDVDPELLGHIRFVATDLLPLSLFGVGLAIWLSRRNK